jgi:hypothetical protein
MDNTDPSRPPNASGPGAGIPVGAWIRLDFPDQPGVLGFTYVDAEAGFSAQGWQMDGAKLKESARVIVRLPLPGVPVRVLSPEEVAQCGLEKTPSWVAKQYGPQPQAGTIWGWWREHPKLRGRFHPEFPDDLQVLMHDGGPRLTDRRPELMWVRVTGGEGDVFSGRLLNRPHQLVSVAEGNEIRFLVPEGGEHPLRVTEKYLRERPEWVILPCNKCGLTELLDAPSDLIRVVFPRAAEGGSMGMFTAFCGNCGGIQVVRHRDFEQGSDGEPPPAEAARPAKKWWQFWK